MSLFHKRTKILSFTALAANVCEFPQKCTLFLSLKYCQIHLSHRHLYLHPIRVLAHSITAAANVDGSPVTAT